ncbi:fatty acyl-CoA reductase wat-like [Trichoplusia ni]|uniref:Fatty acyl-CoA reductase n=1 Tax=Trichoplusia ni TaxID=7111 RepID=A0A7E5WH66_TRINI|nr:fatty acyl-CoA reductase wat-like [Trichoplusia ni]
MDPAVEIELRVRRLQEPMNAVIDLGTSPVQKYYEDTTVFITGGSGFLGKALVEKLFRACKIKKVFLLLRSKKGKTAQERLTEVLQDPAFDLVREKQPRFAERIVPVSGDATEPRLGLSDKDWNTLTKEVELIFHMAATVRFDEPLKVAANINVGGTLKVVELAKSCTKLKQFIHVSTAYTHATRERVGKEVKEQFYPCPMSPKMFMDLVESLEEERLNDITPELIKGWPNTYTFTKALAEHVVRDAGADMPVCVVKPPIVLPAMYEPHPGWLEKSCLGGPSGIVLGVGLGVIHVIYVDLENKLATIPLEYVNNAIIGAAWDSTERQKEGSKEIPIYMVSNEEALVNWGYYSKLLNTVCRPIATPIALWYCYLIETKNALAYWLLSWFLHYIPAYVMDGICAIIGKRPEGITSFVKVFEKIDKKVSAYTYFLTNSWKFRDHNVKAMISRMTENDRAIFNCNVNNIDVDEHTLAWCVGIRKYILKDGLKDSAQGERKQNMLWIANMVFIAVYGYGLLYLARTILCLICYFFRLFV